ncbi:MAG: poly-gamma-glutamate biosynthesis protein PgsC [Armatimonadota bacterium]|nr:poly-gamma-glutamate biosynthesis protein PgsC [Armatimonadota bacterium]
MTEVTMALGILLGLAFHEVVGISPGGVVAPAYLAVFLDQPARVAGTVVVSLVTHAVMRLAALGLLLYGRRKTSLTLAVGFAVRWAWDMLVTGPARDATGAGLVAIGFIVPGLIAVEMERQGVARTWAGLLIVAATVRLVLLVMQELGWR